ncbi:MAG TPA: type 4a pilus biogenesis protein PilO, partial [Vicinamibacterales bacterium]|nr:type 4a pilus biogenesis protein PilO [Vicinamibacterales bacterium]
LDGTFHNLGLFFDRISRFSRIINIGTMAIKAKDKPDQNTSIGVACVATTFVLVEAAKNGAAAAKPPAARGAAPAPGGKS